MVIRFRCTLEDAAGEACGHLATRTELARHAGSECPHRLLECICGCDVAAKDLETHKEVCEEREVECRCGEVSVCQGYLNKHV